MSSILDSLYINAYLHIIYYMIYHGIIIIYIYMNVEEIILYSIEWYNKIKDCVYIWVRLD